MCCTLCLPHGPKQKDLADMQLNKGCKGPEIHVPPNMSYTLSKGALMPITSNEPPLIHILSYSFSTECCDVLHTATGAGVWLMETTMTLAKQQDIVLVVDDTHLHVLLCAQADIDPNRIDFHNEPK